MSIVRSSRGPLAPRRIAGWLAALLVLAAVALYERLPGSDAPATCPVVEAFAERRSDLVVECEGRVSRLLADDLQGSPHQRFIVELEDGHTVLIAHNIELAPRIDALARGDRVSFRGEYEHNERGGVVHWTHHDPRGRRPGGWIDHDGRRYE